MKVLRRPLKRPRFLQVLPLQEEDFREEEAEEGEEEVGSLVSSIKF